MKYRRHKAAFVLRGRRSPLRGAWIEINLTRIVYKNAYCRSPLRGAWIEMVQIAFAVLIAVGRSPLRGAWIEMWNEESYELMVEKVAPPCGERGLKYIASKN